MTREVLKSQHNQEALLVESPVKNASKTSGGALIGLGGASGYRAKKSASSSSTSVKGSKVGGKKERVLQQKFKSLTAIGENDAFKGFASKSKKDEEAARHIERLSGIVTESDYDNDGEGDDVHVGDVDREIENILADEEVKSGGGSKGTGNTGGSKGTGVDSFSTGGKILGDSKNSTNSRSTGGLKQSRNTKNSRSSGSVGTGSKATSASIISGGEGAAGKWEARERAQKRNANYWKQEAERQETRKRLITHKPKSERMVAIEAENARQEREVAAECTFRPRINARSSHASWQEADDEDLDEDELDYEQYNSHRSASSKSKRRRSKSASKGGESRSPSKSKQQLKHSVHGGMVRTESVAPRYL